MLREPLIEGRADAVYGSRFLSSRPHRVLYFWHSVGNWIVTLLSTAFTNVNLSDMETCYKAFRREVIQSIPLLVACWIRRSDHPNPSRPRARTCCFFNVRTLLSLAGFQ